MKKLFVLLLAAAAVLTACGEQSDKSQAKENQTSQDQAKKGPETTKSYQVEQTFEGGKETQVLTVAYSGQTYDQVTLHVTRTIPENIKASLGEQDISAIKEELLITIEEMLGLEQAKNIKGLDVKTDLTNENVTFVLTAHPQELDYAAVAQMPNYGGVFQQMETLSPEDLLNHFKGETGVEVANPNPA